MIIDFCGFQTNSLGEVTEKTDAAGHETNYGYDTLGRMTAETFPDEPQYFWRTWTYATTGHAAGRLIGETRGGYSRALTYNALGEPVSDTETFAGTAWTMHYGWDTLGRLASLTYPGTAAAQPLEVDYAYDCVFHAKAATDFTSCRPPISPHGSHRIHGMRSPA